MSRSEKAGIWFLLSALIVLLVVSLISVSLKSESQKSDFSQFDQQIARWEKSTAANQQQSERTYTDLDAPQYSAAKSKLNPFPFNPNEMTAEDMQNLGLSQKQTTSIIKFRQKGGEFREKSDFAKMYVISDEEYAVLEPYIQIPERTTKNEKSNAVREKPAVRVELNAADSTTLLTVDGIGPTFARRILSYRAKIKGFVNISQLLEVKGIDSSNFSTLSQSLYVNPFLVQKINVNRAPLDELRLHPYIGYNVALSLVNYRKQHGDYKQLADIKKSALVTEEIYQKISPYLTVQ